jgi:glycosyltransferase involved in cell wall biosynthesis
MNRGSTNLKYISILTPCYNEEENVEELCQRIRETMAGIEDIDYEHILIDNASSDGTIATLRKIIEQDKRVRVIVNTRNFGHIRSPYYGLLQAKGEAVISMASDLQDPPELITDFIAKWREGYKVVLGIKAKSEETWIFFALRSLYYKVLHSLTDVELIEHFTGFGLYDQEVIEILRKMDDPYPYFRGLIADIGFPFAKIEFVQPLRRRGITKNNFYTLYDMAMLGMTSYTKVPLRLATMFGFGAAVISFLVGMFYLIYKLANWKNFTLGVAPLVVGFFFFGAVQLFFLGMLGEYIGAIYTQILHRPPVIEKERINF